MKNPTPLVMIHGLLGSIAYFSPASYLEGRNVHTPDLIGYGARQARNEAAPLTLQDQARSVAEYIKESVGQPAWLLGHSVGGAVAMAVAQLSPELVTGLISVEGNFTLNDAFWCRKIAAMREDEWLDEYRSMQEDPRAWLQRSDIEPTPQQVRWAGQILQNQPPATVHAMARAVVNETGAARYLQGVRAVVDSGLPIYLVAGEKSQAGWDVPDWVRAAARDYVVQRNAGHMMMLEAPGEFCRIVGAIIR